MYLLTAIGTDSAIGKSKKALKLKDIPKAQMRLPLFANRENSLLETMQALQQSDLGDVPEAILVYDLLSISTSKSVASESYKGMMDGSKLKKNAVPIGVISAQDVLLGSIDSSSSSSSSSDQEKNMFGSSAGSGSGSGRGSVSSGNRESRDERGSSYSAEDTDEDRDSEIDRKRSMRESEAMIRTYTYIV